MEDTQVASFLVSLEIRGHEEEVNQHLKILKADSGIFKAFIFIIN